MPHVEIPQTICRSGVARRDITPPVGIYHRMWGAAVHERASGVHRPLTATALAIAPADSTESSAAQVVVAVDHCLLWKREMLALVARAAEVAQIEARQIQIAFSHTHAAGLMDPRRADAPGGELIAPYLAQLAERIGEAAGEAVRGLCPATIVYGTGRCDLARHRDFWDAAAGIFVCGLDPAGPCDDTLLVARITRDPDGQVLATLVNYACHPTTLAWDNTLISPDYVGATRERVEQATAAPCLFLQGASGDLGPARGFVGDVGVADSNGRQLGYAALAVLEALGSPRTRYEYAGPVVSGATIGTWQDRPLAAAKADTKRGFACRQLDVPLACRSDLADRAASEAERTRWQAAEQAAQAAGDLATARDCRAQVERMTRQLARLEAVSPGEPIVFAARVWRLGDALWVLVPGEHYHYLQTTLRGRFAAQPVIVSTVTGDWSPGYLPTAETYGRGIYQESIALVAAGSLELLTERIGDALAGLLEKRN